MELYSIHTLVLALVFAIALIMGAVMNRTNFCTMGGVSDWVNIGDTGRMRSWLLAIAVAMTGLLLLEGLSLVQLPEDTMPPYRTQNFAWLRYLVGGLLFGIGMTLGSGCGTKTLVRIGTGNLKSLLVAAMIGLVVYLMFTTQLFAVSVQSWAAPTIVDLSRYGMQDQAVGTIVARLVGGDPAAMRLIVGALIAAALFWFVFRSEDLRASRDNIIGGVVVGLAIVAGWYITAGPLGQAWYDYAMFADQRPSRVGVQSFTFVSPIGDSLRYLLEPTQLTLLTFGTMAVFGVIAGSFLYGLFTGGLRFERFHSFQDFRNHAVGGLLMGYGGFVAMGCTIGQGITGLSTVALGSFLAFGGIVAGAAATMKVQYYLMDERGFWPALRAGD
ncbi:MAG TPA: YeeE/YedE family protein [Burkholderiaceae bacterium]|jgi:uncharacterized protein|nr:YeeE/YedE family protein [Burkholderiaceae bacterium]